MVTYAARPQSLKDKTEYNFRKHSANREAAAIDLLKAVRRTFDPDEIDYLLMKGCRQLIHEYARKRREETPREKNLMEYPICTSKYLGMAGEKDLKEEIAVHTTMAATNGNKAQFFSMIYHPMRGTGLTVNRVLSEADLQAFYSQTIG